MNLKPSPIALATHDGVVTGLGTRTQTHPLYGTPSYGLRMQVDNLTLHELALGEQLLSRGGTQIGKVAASLRSGIAQLGVAGFNEDCTQSRFRNQTIEMETLVTDLANDSDGRLIESLQRTYRSGARVRIARCLLLPKESFQGQVGMPLRQDLHFTFNRHELSNDQLDAIWTNGSAREAILSIRKSITPIPEALAPGHYFVGTVDAHTGDDFWVIEPKLLRGEREIPVLHDQSCLFDPRRTTGQRQVEIRNINGKSEHLSGLKVVASVYTTNPAHLHCDHLEGV